MKILSSKKKEKDKEVRIIREHWVRAFGSRNISLSFVWGQAQ
jgi:hypothetical protein